MDKTKNDLINELNEANSIIASLQKQLKEAEKIEKCYNDGLTAGKEVKASLDGLKDAGLPEEYAWELLLTAMSTFGGVTK